MYFRFILQNWTREAIQDFTIMDVEYLRTFSISEFKNYFGLDKITVCKHPSGCLYFSSRIKEWGIVNCDTIPTMPLISLARDSKGHILFILHEKGHYPKSITPYHGKKVERYHPVTAKTSYPPTRAEYERYVEESYLDAFEGDPDAYWNID